MEILQPYDLNEISIADLLNQKLIIEKTSKNSNFYNSIFPDTTELNIVPGYDSERIVTFIDAELFNEFKILDKLETNVFNDNGSKRDYIKSITYGGFENSVKRYTHLSTPIDLNNDANDFLNLQKPLLINPNRLNANKRTNFNPNFEVENIEQTSTHPHINQNVRDKKVIKYNDKTTIIQVLKWAKEQGIRYIYCINEHRPHVISHKYLSSFVYYTIKGF